MPRAYDKYRDQLMRENPFCARCGAEAGVGHERLEYHHRTPQHTGESDHADGYLMCARCHHQVHGVERRQHKIVDDDGYTHGVNPYAKKQHLIERQSRADKIAKAWGC